MPGFARGLASLRLKSRRAHRGTQSAARGTSPEPQSAAPPHVPGTLERQRKGVRGLAQGSARSALPFCLKAAMSRCAAHFCAGSRTRFRCASPFRERAAGPHLAAVRPSLHFPPQPGHPGRSAAESRDPSPTSIGSQSPHPEEQTRLGLRLEGRGWRWPRWLSLLESRVLRDAMRSRMAPQDEVVEGETFYGRFGAAAKAA